MLPTKWPAGFISSISWGVFNSIIVFSFPASFCQTVFRLICTPYIVMGDAAHIRADMRNPAHMAPGFAYIHKEFQLFFFTRPKVKARTISQMPMTTMAQPPKMISHSVDAIGMHSSTKPAMIEMIA